MAGGRVTNFTSGQGLILMKEVLYVISGKRLPVVFHIGARAITSQSLNIHCGHDDVMGVADCGWGMLFARNAQEAADLALIARRAAEHSETPFFNVQDGFLTTHTIESVMLPEPEMMAFYIEPPQERLRALFDPATPMLSGCVQNQESYMKGRVAQRLFFERVRPALKAAMDEYADLTGRRYDLVRPYRMEDAEYAIVGMGSMMETAEATVDYLRSKGVAIGAVTVTSFRPFPSQELASALLGCRAVTIIERTDQPLRRLQRHDQERPRGVRQLQRLEATVLGGVCDGDHLAPLRGPADDAFTKLEMSDLAEAFGVRKCRYGGQCTAVLVHQKHSGCVTVHQVRRSLEHEVDRLLQFQAGREEIADLT